MRKSTRPPLSQKRLPLGTSRTPLSPSAWSRALRWRSLLREAAGDSDDAELNEVSRELEADLNFRDRLDTEANQLAEQGEFRAADLLCLRADALQDQITVKLAHSADLCGIVEEAKDVRAGRLWEKYSWEEDSC